MPKTVDDIDTLQAYLHRVIERADHHARWLDEIIFPLVGLVVLHKDADQVIEVHQKDGTMGNVLWVWIKGNRYAIAYNHNTHLIEVRDRTWSGDVRAEFDNNSTIADIKQAFSAL